MKNLIMAAILLICCSACQKEQGKSPLPEAGAYHVKTSSHKVWLGSGEESSYPLTDWETTRRFYYVGEELKYCWYLCSTDDNCNCSSGYEVKLVESDDDSLYFVSNHAFGVHYIKGYYHNRKKTFEGRYYIFGYERLPFMNFRNYYIEGAIVLTKDK